MSDAGLLTINGTWLSRRLAERGAGITTGKDWHDSMDTTATEQSAEHEAGRAEGWCYCVHDGRVFWATPGIIRHTEAPCSPVGPFTCRAAAVKARDKSAEYARQRREEAPTVFADSWPDRSSSAEDHPELPEGQWLAARWRNAYWALNELELEVQGTGLSQAIIDLMWSIRAGLGERLVDEALGEER